jgi:uncharacterized surface protein with fasciclin (FAS1) repeats
MMKKLMNFPTFLLLAFLSLAVVSCDSDDDAGDVGLTSSAYDLTKSNPNFSSLAAAIERADLVDVLDGDGTFTVFAPTNTAFAEFLSDNNFASLDAVPVDVLRATLLYHVLGTSVRSTELAQGYVKTASSNVDGDAYDAYINLDVDPSINNAEIDLSMADIAVDNGIVHVIDEVLTLPSVADLAIYNPVFSNLVTAVVQENLDGTLTDQNATFTVFAPTNDAFQALVDADPNDSINSVADILALNNLTDILLYHVVDGAAVRAEDIMNGQVVDPITTGTFTIDTTNGVVITDGSGTDINVIVTNVTAANGVVHAIDFVLRPA